MSEHVSPTRLHEDDFDEIAQRNDPNENRDGCFQGAEAKPLKSENDEGDCTRQKSGTTTEGFRKEG